MFFNIIQKGFLSLTQLISKIMIILAFETVKLLHGKKHHKLKRSEVEKRNSNYPKKLLQIDKTDSNRKWAKNLDYSKKNIAMALQHLMRISVP